MIGEAGKWLAGLDKSDPNVEHHQLEALWLHQAHDAVNEPLLKEVLRSPDYRARAAATRVLVLLARPRRGAARAACERK